jgi:cytochrome c1
MIRIRAFAAAAGLSLLLGLTPAHAAEVLEPPAQDWGFQGLFGTFDRGGLQRGFQVYKEVCSSCHGMQFLAYRNLEAIGLTPEQIVTIAAQYEVEDGPNDEGEMFTRPALPADPFARPFPNEQAARFANGGAYPPDLSLITKARLGGPDYIYALMTGYEDPPPAGVTMMPGMNYNAWFPGHQIAMPPQLSDGRVDYADGTEATVSQMASDIVTFLSWAAEPELEERKRLGIKVMLFLIVLTAMLYALKRQVWADVH